MPTSVRNRRLNAVVMIICGVADLACGCSSSVTPSSVSSPAPRTATASITPSPSTSSSAAEALAVYAAMWKDVAQAGSTDDSQAPYLGNHLSGKALVSITDNLVADKKQGIVGRGAPILHPVVISATASAIAISDCLDDRSWLQYSAATGKLLNTIPGGFRATTATVTDQDGTWKVTQINTEADGTCHLSSPTG